MQCKNALAVSINSKRVFSIRTPKNTKAGYSSRTKQQHYGGIDLSKAQEKGKWGRYLGYGVGAVGLDLSYGLFYSYLSIYLTDVLLMPAAFLLILTPIARIWDGINDPIMGTIVDSTKMRMGKYRPWIIIGAFSNAVVLALLFTNPGIPLNSVWLYIYVAVMYIAWGMTNTMADIPYWSMVPSFTNDPKERNMISTVARTFSGIGQGIITIGTPMMLTLLGTGATAAEKKISADGFSRWAILCAALLVLFAVICASVTKERHVVYNHDKFSFKKLFGVLKSNDQLIVFMLFAMISNAGWYLTSGVGAYYFKSVEGDLSKQSLFAAFGAVGSFLGLFVIPIMQKKYTRRTIYRFCLWMVIAGYGLMILCGPVLHQMLLLCIAYIIASVGIASMFVNQTVMLADIVDYGEYKTGTRQESTTFSMKGFLQKMAYTIQTIILFTGLGLSGYDGAAVVQSEAAKTTISVMTFVVPPILVFISYLIFSKKYKLYGALSETVHAYVAERESKMEDA